MENLPARVPHTLFPDLVSAFVPPDTPYDAELELVITVEGENIPARGFAAYLSLIDRVYGRLSPKGLRSYAHMDEGHLPIAEIHKSELEIIFRTLSGYQDAAAYIILLYLLKCLPNILKAGSESYKTLADARKSLAETRRIDEESKAISEDTRHKELMNRYAEADRYREGLEDMFLQEKGIIYRENRKHIRELIRQESALEKLDDARKSQLARLLNALFTEEFKNLPAPIRFARLQVKALIIRLRGGQPL